MKPHAAPPPENFLDAARFAIPDPPPTHVPRARVVSLMARADRAAVVLVSATAGMGKTSAVAAWARDQPHVGWVSFEKDEEAFWAHVLKCLSGLGIAVPQEWAVVGRAPLGQRRVTELARLLAASPWRATLVLDGLQLESKALGDELDRLLRRCSGRLRLVLVGRVDPVFPFYRYALQDLMVEIRSADLVFTDQEAAQVLRRAGIVLDDEAMERSLTQRLRGWPVGLHLAARALASREALGGADPADYEDVVTSQTATIDEFLVGEVLDRLRPDLRQAVLDTSVPDVLCQELAEELVGPGAAHAFASFSELRSLVEPESGQPGWFRYPTVMRDLMRARLAYESPDRLVTLHRRTAAWLRRAGMVAESLGHLAEAASWDDVLEEIVGGLRIGHLLLEGPHGPMSGIARRVPTELDGGAACVVRAAVALSDRDPHRCRQELERARSVAIVEVPTDEVRVATSLVGALLASRTGEASVARDLAQAAERGLAEGLADASPTCAAQLFAIAVVSKGYVALRTGDLTTAVETLQLATEHPPPGAGAWFRADCLAHLALAEVLRGDLTRAVSLADDALECAEAGDVARGEPPVVAAQVALAMVALERDDIDLGRAMVQAARDSIAGVGDAIVRGLFVAADAELARLSGRYHRAMERFEEAAGDLAARDPWLADHVRMGAALGCVSAADLDRASGFIGSLQLAGRPATDVVSLALQTERAPDGPGPRVDPRAELRLDETLPRYFQVTALLLDSYRHAQRRSPGRSRAGLESALKLARAEQLRSPFRDAGPAVRRWLETEPYVRRRGEWLSGDHTEEVSDAHAHAVHIAVDPLTPKETEVLEHLADLLTTEEIADKMFVSVNTVRTHIRSLLRKLGVSRRNAAIRRAREIGILPS